MKKTLIFIGSARKEGHTKSIVNEFLQNLKGDVEIIDAYRIKNISPCLDCRFCWKKPECAIKDGMSELYEKIKNADSFIFASPMYFHSIPGPMKILIDRFQVYWASNVRGDKKDLNKKSVIAMVGGAPNFEKQFKAGYQLLEGVSGDLDAKVIGSIEFSNSDHVVLNDLYSLKEKIKKLALELEN